MILDVTAFVASERPYWSELESMLMRIEGDPNGRIPLIDATRFYYLYRRASSALLRAGSFSSDPDTRAYLESLVARAYAELHEARSRSHRFSLKRYLFSTFPRTFRKHIHAFWLTVVITVVGIAFGAGSLHFDPDAKPVLMPFSNLNETPAQRVKREESARDNRIAQVSGVFSAELMTHNIQVALFTLALGVTWGVGSVAILFYNGVTLGAVAADYLQAGYAPFLFGWLLPHGAFEIPAILIAGQVGFVLARALIGWGDGRGRRMRLRLISGDIVTLVCGIATMLVWAGIVEAFFSQYHKPVLPYEVKIAFGLTELLLLIAFLSLAGRKTQL